MQLLSCQPITFFLISFFSCCFDIFIITNLTSLRQICYFISRYYHTVARQSALISIININFIFIPNDNPNMSLNRIYFSVKYVRRYRSHVLTS